MPDGCYEDFVTPRCYSLMQFSNVGNVMREFATQYLEEGKLFELRFNKRIPKRQICIVKNNKLPLSTPGDKLLNLIISSAYESDK